MVPRFSDGSHQEKPRITIRRLCYYDISQLKTFLHRSLNISYLNDDLHQVFLRNNVLTANNLLENAGQDSLAEMRIINSCADVCQDGCFDPVI